MRTAALNLAALSFTIAGASACATSPEPTTYNATPALATDPTHLAAPSDVAGQTFFTTDPAYFATPKYGPYPTYFMIPTYGPNPTYFVTPTFIAVGGFHRHHHHACGHPGSHAHHR